MRTVDTKYTPAPWVVGNNYAEGSDSLIIRCDCIDGQALAEVYLDEIGQEEGMREANAALIAAAPELLEALTKAIILMEHTGGFGDTVRLSKMLIAKATGN